MKYETDYLWSVFGNYHPIASITSFLKTIYFELFLLGEEQAIMRMQMESDSRKKKVKKAKHCTKCKLPMLGHPRSRCPVPECTSSTS